MTETEYINFLFSDEEIKKHVDEVNDNIDAPIEIVGESKGEQLSFFD